MKHRLTNNLLNVVIDTHGAELQNITSVATGHEYLWQGNPEFWGRRSPVLFPIVGAVWDGHYRMDGTAYALGQHGFARDCDFTATVGAADDEAWFTLDASEATLALYPRHFRLEIGYALRGRRIEVMWRVTNTDSRKMSFQIGAHPAFNYPDFNPADPIHGYFELGTAGPLIAETIEAKGCVGSTVRTIATDAEGMLPIRDDTFALDAIILADKQVHRVSLLDKRRTPYLTLLFESPLVGLWSPSAAAPFVCIEPWWGRCDSVGFQGEFSKRSHINVLETGQTFETSYAIIVDNV